MVITNKSVSVNNKIKFRLLFFEKSELLQQTFVKLHNNIIMLREVGTNYFVGVKSSDFFELSTES